MSLSSCDAPRFVILVFSFRYPWAAPVLRHCSTLDPWDGFEEEVRTLSRLRHPNLVTLMGWGQHEAAKYLVYELLGGDVIGRLLKCKRGETGFDWQQRTRVGTDAACGLSYMMNCEPKAFHRDIKPANILLDANGTAKKADFGLSGTAQETSPGRRGVHSVCVGLTFPLIIEIFMILHLTFSPRFLPVHCVFMFMQCGEVEEGAFCPLAFLSLLWLSM